jgi:hypothetical protein
MMQGEGRQNKVELLGIEAAVEILGVSHSERESWCSFGSHAGGGDAGGIGIDPYDHRDKVCASLRDKASSATNVARRIARSRKLVANDR